MLCFLKGKRACYVFDKTKAVAMKDKAVKLCSKAFFWGKRITRDVLFSSLVSMRFAISNILLFLYRAHRRLHPKIKRSYDLPLLSASFVHHFCKVLKGI